MDQAVWFVCPIRIPGIPEVHRTSGTSGLDDIGTYLQLRLQLLELKERRGMQETRTLKQWLKSLYAVNTVSKLPGTFNARCGSPTTIGPPDSVCSPDMTHALLPPWLELEIQILIIIWIFNQTNHINYYLFNKNTPTPLKADNTSLDSSLDSAVWSWNWGIGISLDLDGRFSAHLEAGFPWTGFSLRKN